MTSILALPDLLLTFGAVVYIKLVQVIYQDIVFGIRNGWAEIRFDVCPYDHHDLLLSLCDFSYLEVAVVKDRV